MTDKRAIIIEQARSLRDLAWEVGGQSRVTDDLTAAIMTLNGLLALALTEFASPPIAGYLPVRLSDLREDDNAPF